MKMAMLALVAATASTAGAAPVAHRPSNIAPARAAPLTRIEMETKSFWFALSAAGTDFISSWQIDADGTGLFRSIEWKRVGDIFQRSDVTRRFSAGRRGFRGIATLLSAAESGIEEGRIRCDEVAYTDSAHGFVAWTRGGIRKRAEFDQGCPTDGAQLIFKRMDEAEKLVAAWGAKGRIVSSLRLPDKP